MVPSPARRVVVRRPTATTVPVAGPEIDGVADAVLVLQGHEDAGQEILDQVLRAECQRHTGDAGRGEQRRDVDAELGQDQHGGDR